tara:strand:+ start:1033 stop:1305 length:273 start_codon:yes stop_codon:yes gene_type:complete
MSDEEKKDETDLDKVFPDESFSLKLKQDLRDIFKPKDAPIIEKIFGFANLTDLKLKLFSPNHENFWMQYWYFSLGFIVLGILIILIEANW